jgi:hypothetical protein
LLIGSESIREAHIGALPEPIVKKIRKKELADWFRVYTRNIGALPKPIVKKIRKKCLLIGSESIPEAHIGALPEPIVKKIIKKIMLIGSEPCTRSPHWCTA